MGKRSGSFAAFEGALARATCVHSLPETQPQPALATPPVATSAALSQRSTELAVRKSLEVTANAPHADVARVAETVVEDVMQAQRFAVMEPLAGALYDSARSLAALDRVRVHGRDRDDAVDGATCYDAERERDEEPRSQHPATLRAPAGAAKRLR